MSTTTEENDDDEITIEPSRAFTEALVEQVNREDVLSMVELQKDMLSRYEKTNEMLINFNMLSSTRCEATTQDFRKHTQILGQMKADLDVIFRRIRSLKQRLGALYPEAFAACSDVYNILENTEVEEDIKEEKCPMEIRITDTTKSEHLSLEPGHSVNGPLVNDEHKDQADILNDEFQASCDMRQNDPVGDPVSEKQVLGDTSQFGEIPPSCQSVCSTSKIGVLKNHNSETLDTGKEENDFDRRENIKS